MRTKRKSSTSGLDGIKTPSTFVLILCYGCLFAIIAYIAWRAQVFSPFLMGKDKPGRFLMSRVRASIHPTRHLHFGERFGNIFHTDLEERFMAKGASGILNDTLAATLLQMKQAGITTVAFSSPWYWFEAKEGAIRFDFLDSLLDLACTPDTSLKVALILDLVRAPDWVYKIWPTARAVDSHKREYPLLSWFHPDANKRALRALTSVVEHLAMGHPGCLVAVQPVYNNQYQARYTQEHDCHQDYSAPAVAAFREWLQARQPQLAEINARWGTSFKSWQEVEPPVLAAGLMGVDATARYWDFMTFRELAGAEVLNRACAAVQGARTVCFHRMPEVFTVLDGLYGTTLIKHVAASPHTDFLVVNSNFRTPYGTWMDPLRIRLNIAAALSYGKPVFFESAVESSPAMELLEAAFRHALSAGASGVGVTNWLHRYQMDEHMQDALAPKLDRCRTEEVVGLFLHLDSFSAFHGLQWTWSRKDPVHDFVQDLADTLGGRCETSVFVHLELGRFLRELPSFSRAVFVEPLVLLGDAELNLYSQIKSYIRTMPHQVLHMPLNRTGGTQLTVIQDLQTSNL